MSIVPNPARVRAPTIIEERFSKLKLINFEPSNSGRELGISPIILNVPGSRAKEIKVPMINATNPAGIFFETRGMRYIRAIVEQPKSREFKFGDNIGL